MARGAKSIDNLFHILVGVGDKLLKTSDKLMKSMEIGFLP